MKSKLNLNTKNNRGVTEILSYSLMFGAIISFIILASVSGLTLVDNERSAQATTTTENQLTRIDQNVESIQQGAESQNLIVEIPGGTIAQEQEKTTVTINGTAKNGTAINISFTTTPLVYQAPETELLIYDGGIIASDRTGQELVQSTGLVHADQEKEFNSNIPSLVFPSFDPLNGNESVNSQTGASPVPIKMQSIGNETGPTIIPLDTTNKINITVTSAHSNAWATFFNQIGFNIDETDISSDEFTARNVQNKVQGNTLIVGYYELEIGFKQPR